MFSALHPLPVLDLNYGRGRGRGFNLGKPELIKSVRWVGWASYNHMRLVLSVDLSLCNNDCLELLLLCADENNSYSQRHVCWSAFTKISSLFFPFWAN